MVSSLFLLSQLITFYSEGAYIDEYGTKLILKCFTHCFSPRWSWPEKVWRSLFCM